jgi:hypothetical protein
MLMVMMIVAATRGDSDGVPLEAIALHAIMR